jgi:hypothetical protein
MAIDILAGDFDQCHETLQEEVWRCENQGLTEIGGRRCPTTESEWEEFILSEETRCMAARGYSRAYFTWDQFERCENVWFDRVNTLESLVHSLDGHAPPARVREARDNWSSQKDVARREWIGSYRTGLLPRACWIY